MNSSRTKWIIGIVLAVIIIVILSISSVQKDNINEYRIGFVGPITTTSAKYGTFEAVNLAVEEINSRGGINGKKIVLIAEDGQCNSAIAAGAVSKLINIDKVKVILGGHCTPESTVVAKAAGENKVFALASITSSPSFTNINKYFARTTWLSTQQSEIIAKYATQTLNLKKVAIIYGQTDYARPIAEKMKSEFVTNGGTVVIYESFVSGINDFRSILAKIKSAGADSIFLSAQTPDETLNFIRQTRELGLTGIKVFGNDQLNVQVNIDKEPIAYEGVAFASPDFSVDNPHTKVFIDAYKAKYKVDNIPSGILTAESYDAVYILADAMAKYGLDTDKISGYIRGLEGFQGASGTITINKDGDGVRSYQMRIIRGGKVQTL